MKIIKILTVDVGGGHKAPAQAIKQQLDRLDIRDTETEVVDMREAIHTKLLYSIYKGFWVHIALKYPPLIKALYGTADNAVLVRIIDFIFGVVLIPRFRKYIHSVNPDIIISTYFTFTHYLEILKRERGFRPLTISLNPEPFESLAIWVTKKLHYSFVFSQRAKAQMLAKGVPERKIKVFNFPVKPEFSKQQKPVDDVRADLKIKKNILTILFNFGAEGVGPTKKYLKAILKNGLPVQIILICGRNRELKKNLENLKRNYSGSTELLITGFVDNMEDYIYASDLVIGKAGPNSVFEALVIGRPVVITSFMENERSTVQWIIQNRIGWHIRSVSNLVKFIERIEASPVLLLKYYENIKRLHLKSGTEEIAEFLINFLKSPADK
ncbi:MAG: hypothetical protein GXP33_15365 [Spirochaetes bacterium]|nr:hypothetical protein [Spirochaetota bacterium]